MPALEMISGNLLFHFQCYMLCLLSFHTRLTSPLNYLGYSCLETAYDPHSATGRIYRTNLNFTLHTLSSNASRTDTNGFYNFSTGNDPSNTVYGLFLCRGDVNPDVCQECVSNASIKVFQLCLNQKVAIVWYDECFLRFSDRTIFSKADFGPGYSLYNPLNITGPKSYDFGKILRNLLYQAANQAADDAWGKRFAVQEGNISSDRKMYTLTECTPDLSAGDCKSCLTKAIKELPSYGFFDSIGIGGRLLLPSCSVRYELYRFYNTVSSAPSPMLTWFVAERVMSVTADPPPNSAPPVTYVTSRLTSAPPLPTLTRTTTASSITFTALSPISAPPTTATKNVTGNVTARSPDSATMTVTSNITLGSPNSAPPPKQNLSVPAVPPNLAAAPPPNYVPPGPPPNPIKGKSSEAC